MADDALRAARDAVALAQSSFAEMQGGKDIPQNTQQVMTQLQLAQLQIAQAAREKTDCAQALAKSQSDLAAANQQLAQSGRQANGKPIGQGIWVPVKAALGMTLVGTLLGVGGGVAGVKIVDAQKKKKELEAQKNGTAKLKERSAT